MVEYHYAKKLAAHDEFVRDAPEIEAETRKLEPRHGALGQRSIPQRSDCQAANCST